MSKASTSNGISRRDFIKTTSAASMVAMVSGGGALFAGGSDQIKVGLIGSFSVQCAEK